MGAQSGAEDQGGGQVVTQFFLDTLRSMNPTAAHVLVFAAIACLLLTDLLVMGTAFMFVYKDFVRARIEWSNWKEKRRMGAKP
jgi:hypothetical protein